jgi:15-cis-phytoene synthase
MQRQSEPDHGVSGGDVSRDYEYCRRVTRNHAKSFYFCAQFLSRDKRDAIYAVYALCRHIDDFVDDAKGRTDESTRTIVESWRELIRESSTRAHPALHAWHDARLRFGIDPTLFDELVKGVLSDLTTTRYATYADLDLYCYRVASVVGLMACEIFGYFDDAALGHAADLGRAMQLTNICRDVGEDAAMGRIYLPLDELDRFGVSEQSILDRRFGESFRELMRFQLARARRYYHAAEPGIDMLEQDSRFTVRLSSRIYGQILERIERNGYDSLSRRAYVPLSTKLATVPRVWLESARGQRVPTRGS